MNEHLSPKKVDCTCGNTIEAVMRKTWCPQCCNPVFYYEKDKRMNRLNGYYMATAIAFAMGLMAYFVIELAFPLFG
jgi:hypothetical protein